MNDPSTARSTTERTRFCGGGRRSSGCVIPHNIISRERENKDIIEVGMRYIEIVIYRECERGCVEGGRGRREDGEV